MLLKTALVVDVNNLYFSVQDKFGNRRIQMSKYVESLEKLGHTLTYKIAFSRQKPAQARAFCTLLQETGFELFFGETQIYTAMALKVADVVPTIDSLVIGSNYEEAGRILHWAKNKGKLTKCYGVKLPPRFRQFSTCMEIEEDILDEAREEAK